MIHGWCPFTSLQQGDKLNRNEQFTQVFVVYTHSCQPIHVHGLRLWYNDSNVYLIWEKNTTYCRFRLRTHVWNEERLKKTYQRERWESFKEAAKLEGVFGMWREESGACKCAWHSTARVSSLNWLASFAEHVVLYLRHLEISTLNSSYLFKSKVAFTFANVRYSAQLSASSDTIKQDAMLLQACIYSIPAEENYSNSTDTCRK